MTTDQTEQPVPSEESKGAAMPPTQLHEAILESLASAVISLESGVITYFNETARLLTGLDPDAVIGVTFAEAFFDLDGTEEFAEAVLAAVYEDALVRQRVVKATFPSGAQVLSVSVTRTRSATDQGDAASNLAVVFDDVSEVLELREKELVLAREVEARHTELRDAYVELEERNKHLAEAEGKMRLVRIGGTAAVVVLLAMLVIWVALPGAGLSETTKPEVNPVAASNRTIVIEPQSLTTVVNITGNLGPKQEVEVTSPISGKVALVNVPYGAKVEAGQSLLGLDVTDVLIQQRDAEANFIRARERLQEVENWTDSVEASRARRSVTKARIDLADGKRRLDETSFLLERGVIPSSEMESAKRNYEGRVLDLEAAEQDLAVILAKGTSDSRIARLELANATTRLEELEQTLQLAEIKAPIEGIVMRPPATSSRDSQQANLVAGKEVVIGEHLLTIGDTSGLSVNGQVDEVDVVQIRVGNPVKVTGEAFPGLVLHGSIARVSSEATVVNDGRSLPYFETVAVIDSLTPTQLAALRIGMSVVLEVVVREDSEVLLIPVEAVEFVEGETVVTVVRADDAQRVVVSTGMTTLESVEVTSGLSPGDKIRVPN